MRKNLFLFNPDHDLALANHDINYMPPASARQLGTDLALLPVWYAGRDNSVLAPSAYNSSFLKEMLFQFPQLASLLTEPEVAMVRDINFMPWGWDPAVHKRLIQLGVSPRDLPDQAQLMFIRERSHRLQAVRLLKHLQAEHTCGESFYFTELHELRHFVESHTFCLLKSPLSSSGKGLNWCKGVFTHHINDWCRNVIRQQGGVVAEPLYDKVVDFAMLFYADGEKGVRFAGYSIFRTGQTGAYDGNMLDSDREMERRLSPYISSEMLLKTRLSIEKYLVEMLDGIYTGYLGVDMMICRSYDMLQYRLHPCVEINLRMTMGASARLFYDRYVQNGRTGIFQVSYFSDNEQLRQTHKQMLASHPLRMSDGRIVEGYMPLVPVTPRAKYSAWILIGGGGELFHL